MTGGLYAKSHQNVLPLYFMIRWLAILPLLAVYNALMMNSCAEYKKPGVNSKDELILFLDSIEQKYEAACVQMGLANWNSYSNEAPYDLNKAKRAFSLIFSDTNACTIIKEWRQKSGSLADKLLMRRLDLWYKCCIGGAIYADSNIAPLENLLQETITNFKFTLNGKPITRSKVNILLRKERKQSQRHRLWSLSSQLSAMTSNDLIHLVKLRNEKARAFGFPNYYSLSLFLNSIDEKWLIGTFDELEEQTRDTFKNFIATSQKKLHITNFGPWDFNYALRTAVLLPDRYFPPDSIFNIIHEFERGIGFMVDSLPIREVVKDIPYGGLSLAITIPTDSRFLINPTKGKEFYGIAFHEYGHSLKAVYTHVNYPILRGYEWIPGAQCSAYEEGIADMHREFTDDSLWLATFIKVKPEELERYLKGRSLLALYRLRRIMKDFFFEYEMYKDPDQDLAKLEKDMFKTYLLVDLDKEEPPQFAASIWYTSYPCYYQNYIIAGMIATQLQEALLSKFGEQKINNPNVAQWMINHLYEKGETEEWPERIRNASGKSLETGAYLRKVGIDQSIIGK